MNSCLNCNKPVENKYCNVSCQNQHQGSIRANKRYGEIKTFEVKCRCGKEFEVQEREKLFPKKEHYNCSRSCANKRTHSEETKEKIKNSLKKTLRPLKKKRIIIKCKQCEKEIVQRRKTHLFCSRSCTTTWKNLNTDVARKAGLASVKSQSEIRRSKNEIYFANLCKEKFNKVLTNKPLFNGWDADVIIEDFKIAVLWNGKWHYEKITEAHSVKQVQNRDKIKTKEIIKKGYVPYVIKDLGKANNKKVKKEFEVFIDYLKQNNYICV